MSWYCRHGSDRFAFSTERGTSSEFGGGLDLIDVVLPDSRDHTSFQIGQELEIPIRVNGRDSRLTYRYQVQI
jgi:hypothetical protein